MENTACGHGKVEISDPLRRYLPHEARRGPPQNLFGGLGKIGLPKWAINDPIYKRTQSGTVI